MLNVKFVSVKDAWVGAGIESGKIEKVIICPTCGGCMGVDKEKDDRINSLCKTLASTRRLLERIAEDVREYEHKKLMGHQS